MPLYLWPLLIGTGALCGFWALGSKLQFFRICGAMFMLLGAGLAAKALVFEPMQNAAMAATFTGSSIIAAFIAVIVKRKRETAAQTPRR